LVRERHARHGLIVTQRRGIACLVLDRPADRNRLTPGMAAALVEACEAVEDGNAIAVEIRGRGSWFCGGLADGVRPADLHGRLDPVTALAGITKPVVAVLAGPAAGVGAALALAADIRIAAARATIDFVGGGSQRLPGFGVTQRLPRIVGRTRALEMLLVGEPIPASVGATSGLLSRVAPAARDLEAVAGGVRATLRCRGPLALALAKEAVLRAGELPLAEGIRMEEDLYALLQTTEDRAEGIRSFLGRRRPRFRGR
jgi:enoyl-CoA hydratase/carnithine racemase